ncbi:arsenate reductase family protein [Oceanobacillus sp. J11TS1]|uniref:arsenate reductase family protein n=1 Tax=Oceanobacillus sp. J11TS1 TaxID=2807191 RepID=UPI001B1D06AA|nr:arsenate reductase family protein [Oceanobacillus sp. J11TS1]GIO23718.1 arsenate reductase [Oceanobacillus sp. J11TS1]
MTLSFYWYPKCGTCRNAKKWLDENQIDYKPIHIVEEPPSENQIRSWMETSDIPAKKFFNTSGKKYRELQLKEKINDLSHQEMAEILASDGMLIKRPILTDGEKVTVGFKEETYSSVWK